MLTSLSASRFCLLWPLYNTSNNRVVRYAMKDLYKRKVDLGMAISVSYSVGQFIFLLQFH